MNILFLGDIVGKPGRQAVLQVLPRLVDREAIDLAVANCENATDGVGIKPEHVRQLLDAGFDVLTSGNHIWKHRDLLPVLDSEPRLLRPANFPPGTPGRGWLHVSTPGGVEVGVLNLIGRTFMDSVDCPFRAAETLLPEIRREARVILVDLHCDATSEKGAMGWFLDGQVSAVVGTHTHVQTADERILPGGTALHTDAGMCGPRDSVIGMKHELAIRRFRSRLPVRFEVASGPVYVQGTIVSVDEATGHATAIKRVQELVER